MTFADLPAGASVFVDANPLVYHFAPDPNLGAACSQLFARIASREIQVNGSGYPLGLADGTIPLEARIIAVADVFDALTSRRAYKHAWSNDEAFAHLGQLAGVKLDRDCVEALASRREEIEEIQRRFREDPYG